MKKNLKELLRRIYYLQTYSSLKSCGKNVRLSYGGKITRPSELSIGSNIFIGKGFVISARDMHMGDNIMIGPYFLAECDDHVFNYPGKTMYSTRSSRKVEGIRIENDIWIGGHVTVLKGVTISEGCLIGAGSVVTRSLPPYTICYGNPCKPKKSRFSRDEMAKHLEIISSKYSLESILNAWEQINIR